MAVPLNWPLFSMPKLEFSITLARINGHPALTAEIWLQNGWPFRGSTVMNFWAIASDSLSRGYGADIIMNQPVFRHVGVFAQLDL